MPHFEPSEQWLINCLRDAYLVARFSDDKSTKVGAIIYSYYGDELTTGCNKLLVNLPSDAPREEKYMFVAHAEESAISRAAREGKKLSGAIMVCPWAACHDCAKAIVQAGIYDVYAHGDAIDKTPERWEKSYEAARIMFRENGVNYTNVYGKIGGCENLFDGEVWYP